MLANEIIAVKRSHCLIGSACLGILSSALGVLFGFEAARVTQGARDYVWRQADHRAAGGSGGRTQSISRTLVPYWTSNSSLVSKIIGST
jgi:hypothetical protein